MKILLQALIALAFVGFADAAPAQPPPHPAMYSFADVYRLTLAGAAPAAVPIPDYTEAPLRVAVSQPQAGSELRFSVSPIPGPQRWLLLLSGLALAAWVAHRRLIHPF